MTTTVEIKNLGPKEIYITTDGLGMVKPLRRIVKPGDSYTESLWQAKVVMLNEGQPPIPAVSVSSEPVEEA